MSNHTIRLDWDTMVEQRIEPAADTMTKDQTITLQAAEIERLRELVYAVPPTDDMPGTTERFAAQTWKEACEANRDEVARLDNLLRTYRLPDEVVDIKVVIELRAEIERLRGLLREALDPYLRATINWQAGWTDRVREALGE